MSLFKKEKKLVDSKEQMTKLSENNTSRKPQVTAEEFSPTFNGGPAPTKIDCESEKAKTYKK